jgi:hypothetical protein
MHEYRHGQYKMHEHRSRRCSSRLVRCVRNPKSKASVIRPVLAQNHLRPDAQERRARPPGGLLRRLSLQPLDRDQAEILGPMTFGCPISSRALSARLAAIAVPTCGRTSTGTGQSRAEWAIAEKSLASLAMNSPKSGSVKHSLTFRAKASPTQSNN